MMPETLYLARHGETEWNVRGVFQGTTDIPLNRRGRQQAMELGVRLFGLETGITRVYTSRLKRARETGSIVAECLGVPCDVMDGLHEVGLGEWEGISYRDARSRDPELFERWENEKRHTRPPKGETYDEAIQRLIPAISSLAHRESGNTLVITHSACIHTILAELNGTPLETMFCDYHTPNAQPIALDAARVRGRWPLTKI